SYQEIKRYGRHLIIPEVGMAGQKKLKSSKVLVVGAGGLGSPISLYLAAAGVGRIGLVDFDVVDESNLQRQIIYTTKDVKRPKLEVAEERLTAMNPHIEVETYETRLTSENALEIMKDYDVIVDGTDNFPTRYLVNDACVLLGKPNVYGSIFRFDGQVSVFYAKKGPCYRCLYPEPPPPGLVPSCAEGGVLGVLPGVVGALQAMETIKLIVGIGDPLIGRLLLFDGLHMSFTELKLRKDPNCKVCGPNPTVRELIDYEAFCGVSPTPSDSSLHITPEELHRRLERGEKIILLDVREEVEYEICHLDKALLIPLSKLPERVNELSLTDDIVAYCHTGVRSGMAVKLLRDLGFRRVKNLAGGIDAWAERVDPDMPRY
ncbi:MAG: molybdopterin-synthase adenylyltransferase MoeB, partial [Candidatus Caldarchaeum sp.]